MRPTAAGKPDLTRPVYDTMNDDINKYVEQRKQLPQIIDDCLEYIEQFGIRTPKLFDPYPRPYEVKVLLHAFEPCTYGKGTLGVLCEPPGWVASEVSISNNRILTPYPIGILCKLHGSTLQTDCACLPKQGWSVFSSWSYCR